MSGQFERRSLLRLAWPLAVFSLLSAVTTLVDALIVSSYSASLAAVVSLANQILGVGYDCCSILGFGTLVLVAQALGSGDVAAARRIGLLAILAAFAVGLATAAVYVAGAPLFCSWVNTPPDIAPEVELYLVGTALSFGFTGIMTAGAALLRGFGRTRSILVLGTAANVLYLIVEYGLIHGAWGLPELGVVGASLASLIVRGASVVVLLLYLWRSLGITSADVLPFGPGHLREIGRNLRISAPSGADNLATDLAQMVLVAGVASLGTAALTARSHLLTLTTVVPFLVQAVVQAHETLVGYDAGAGDSAAARVRTRRTTTGITVISLILALLVYLFRGHLGPMFSKDPEVLGLLQGLLLAGIFHQPLATANAMLTGSLRSLGDAQVPLLLSLLVTWCVTVPLAHGWMKASSVGVVALGWSLVIGEAVRLLLLGRRWQRLHRKHGGVPRRSSVPEGP